jgi:ABC-type Mn2+/Zn2+ transport system permease subunit
MFAIELYIIFVLFAAPLGCISLWRRCIYMADGLSHASMLAVALSTSFSINSFTASLITCTCVILLIYWFEKSSDIYVSTGVVSSAAVAIAFFITQIMHNHAHKGCDCFNVMALYGNVNSIKKEDIIVAVLFGAIMLLILLFNLRKIILISFNKDIAKTLKVNVNTIDIFFLISAALFINVMVKTIGLLLLSSILIFPALASKLISKSPIKMIVNSVLIGLVSILISFLICQVIHLSFGVLVSLVNTLILFTIYAFQRYYLKISC